jgi:hypothetical protein
MCNFVAAIRPLRLGCHLRMAEPKGWALHCGISDTVRFVFGHLNYHNQIPFEDNGGGDAYGCVYLCAAGVCRGLIMPSCTLLVVLYMLRRVSLCLFYWEGCGRPKCQNKQQEIPSFFSALWRILKRQPSDCWVSVRLFAAERWQISCNRL